jgi:uncharacterized protein (TIGR02118 family)
MGASGSKLKHQRKENVMFVVNVLYPLNGNFDLKYYIDRHMTMVERLWKPFGMSNWFVTRVNGALEGAPTHQIITTLHFESKTRFDDAMKATAAEVMGDVPNYTALTPLMLFGELAGHAQVK